MRVFVHSFLAKDANYPGELKYIDFFYQELKYIDSLTLKHESLPKEHLI